jgi:predicted nucleic acid-binding protein
LAEVVVIDSSILIASVFVETFTERAKALLLHWQQHNIQLAAPRLFHYEIIAVARKAASQERITAQEAVAARDYMLSYPVDTHIDIALLKRAYDFAVQFNRPTAYDSQYLAVAERLQCDFWTADEKLFNAIHRQLDWVKWVGSFEKPPDRLIE